MLNTGIHIYLVEFHNTKDSLIFQSWQDFSDLIPNLGQRQVKGFKEFDRAKNRFKKISKKTVLSRCSFDTDSLLYLTENL